MTTGLLVVCVVVAVLAVQLIASLSPASFATASYVALPESTRSDHFRCFRPFDAIAAFRPRDMSHEDNCLFRYLIVNNASVHLQCDSANVNLSRGCTVVLTLNMSTPTARLGISRGSTPRQSVPMLWDEMRYSLELKGAGKAIHYKGWAEAGDPGAPGHVPLQGYSLCCELIDDSTCEWRNRTSLGTATGGADGPATYLTPTRCPLAPTSATVHNPGEEAASFQGRVTRPLFKSVAGEWEARINFYRRVRYQPLGRVVVPFVVRESDIPPDVRVSHGTDPDGQESASSVALVSPRKKTSSESSGEEGAPHRNVAAEAYADL